MPSPGFDGKMADSKKGKGEGRGGERNIFVEMKSLNP